MNWKLLQEKVTNAEPSAPACQSPPSSGPIHYPVISHSPLPQQALKQDAEPVSQAETSQTGGKDWEPRPEEDWEGIDAPQPIASHGASLMSAQVGFLPCCRACNPDCKITPGISAIYF